MGGTDTSIFFTPLLRTPSSVSPISMPKPLISISSGESFDIAWDSAAAAAAAAEARAAARAAARGLCDWGGALIEELREKEEEGEWAERRLNSI